MDLGSPCSQALFLLCCPSSPLHRKITIRAGRGIGYWALTMCQVISLASHLIFTTIRRSRLYHLPADDERKAQQDKLTCSKSQAVPTACKKDLRFKPDLLAPRPVLFPLFLDGFEPENYLWVCPTTHNPFEAPSPHTYIQSHKGITNFFKHWQKSPKD